MRPSSVPQAKYDFIDEMLKWSGSKSPKRILDVGCGIGGTSRRLAAAFPDAEVIGEAAAGILSPPIRSRLSATPVTQSNRPASSHGLTPAQSPLIRQTLTCFED